MRITEMVRFQQQNRMQNSQKPPPQFSNGSLPPPGHVNPYCPEGMDAIGTTSADRKIISVNEGVANQLREIAYQYMFDNGGMSKDDNAGDVGKIISAYAMILPPEDRLNAVWILNQIFLTEAVRLVEYVHQRDPNLNWEKPVTPGI